MSEPAERHGDGPTHSDPRAEGGSAAHGEMRPVPGAVAPNDGTTAVALAESDGFCPGGAECTHGGIE